MMPTGRKVWTLAKVYATLRDLPEIIPLAAAVGLVLGAAVYTTRREYFSVVGEHFPTKEQRADMEKQISYGQETIKPSVFWRIAQWNRDARGADIAVWPFSNRVIDGEYENLTHIAPRKGVQAEGPAPTEY